MWSVHKSESFFVSTAKMQAFYAGSDSLRQCLHLFNKLSMNAWSGQGYTRAILTLDCHSEAQAEAE